MGTSKKSPLPSTGAFLIGQRQQAEATPIIVRHLAQKKRFDEQICEFRFKLVPWNPVPWTPVFLLRKLQIFQITGDGKSWSTGYWGLG